VRRLSGMPVDVLTGLVNEKGEAMGRPVGVALDKDGALLVAADCSQADSRVPIPNAADARGEWRAACNPLTANEVARSACWHGPCAPSRA
jgi:hypothetical protein